VDEWRAGTVLLGASCASLKETLINAFKLVLVGVSILPRCSCLISSSPPRLVRGTPTMLVEVSLWRRGAAGLLTLRSVSRHFSVRTALL